ncbi:MAG: hypothetical protein ACR2O6_07465 [Ilumatobacteraceae bacterium]
MGKSPQEMIAMMVDGAQPHCDEPLDSAMICSHAGSMTSALTSQFLPGGGGLPKTSELPNPVLIAVGPTTVYAFKYKPRGFKVKLKKGSEVARWSRSSIDVERTKDGKISQFALVTDQGEIYALEVTTALGGTGAYELFMQSLAGAS